MKHFLSINFSDNSSQSHQAGFSLIEMLVVISIIGILSVSLILNFSRTRVDLERSVNLIISIIREAQLKAVSSTTYAGYSPCGYGVHYISSTQIAIYLGQDASSVDCKTIANRNYQAGRDALLRTQSFSDPKIQFNASFNDIFFLPPDPKTYLNNDSSLSQNPMQITISVIGGACPQDCKYIYVYPSGRIQEQ